MATTGLVQVASLASGMLAAHLLLPEGRGALALVVLWPSTLAYLFLLGLADSVLYHAAQARLAPRQVFAAGLWIGIGASALAVGVGWLVAIPLVFVGERSALRDLATVMLAIAPLHILGLVFQELLRARLRLALWNALRVLLQLGYVAAILALVWLGQADVDGFALAFLASHLPPTVIALGVCVAAGWGGLAAPRAAFGAMFRYGLRLHAAAAVAQINLRLDQLLVGVALPPAALGLYVVATTLAQVTATFANSVALVAFPRACATPEGPARNELIGAYLRLTMALVLTATAALVFLAPLVLRLLFGPAFVEATDIVRLMATGVLPLCLKEFFVLALKAADRPRPLATAELVTLAVNAGLLTLAVPALGLMGAAATYVATRWITAAWLGWRVRADLRLSLRRLMTPRRDDVTLLRDFLRPDRGAR